VTTVPAPTAPPASYPGTIAAFTVKEDGEVIYGAHANSWQNEIVATQQIVGRNPHQLAVPNPSNPATPPATVSDRIGLLERTTVYTSGAQRIGGAKEMLDPFTVDSGQVLSGDFDFRPNGGQYRVLASNSGIQGRNGAGTADADLLFQPGGGILRRHGYKVWDEGNDGPGSGLDADTLDGFQAGDFLLRSGCQVQMAANQDVPSNPLNADTSNWWRTLNLTTVVWEQQPGDGSMFNAATKIWTIPTTGLWLMSVVLCQQQPSNGGRSMRIVNGNYAVNTPVFTPGFTWYGHNSDRLADWLGNWPTSVNNNPNSIVQIPHEEVFFRFLTAGTKLRLDVNQYNAGGVTATYFANGFSTHAHVPTHVTFANVT
jgi:hypothetical protein